MLWRKGREGEARGGIEGKGHSVVMALPRWHRTRAPRPSKRAYAACLIHHEVGPSKDQAEVDVWQRLECRAQD